MMNGRFAPIHDLKLKTVVIFLGGQSLKKVLRGEPKGLCEQLSIGKAAFLPTIS
jgi:hypothetical protein